MVDFAVLGVDMGLGSLGDIVDDGKEGIGIHLFRCDLLPVEQVLA
jgi:hypothetical protein